MITEIRELGGGKDMITEIRELIHLLSTDPLRAEDVARHIGSVLEDNGPSGGMRVQPSNPRFGAAIVFRDARNDAPMAVDLVPASAQKLTVAALHAAFGPYEAGGVSTFEEPDELLFGVEQVGTPYTAVVIATLTEPGVDPETADVGSITLRRDPRP